MTKVSMVQYQKHLCKKLRQEKKLNTKGEVKERGRLILCLAVHLLPHNCQIRHVIPRDTLANGFL